MQKLILTIILFLALDIAIAQQFNFTNIGTNRGLPSSECYGMMQDSKGYMWIRTLNGLSKFDGKKFKNFTIKEGLKSNAIYALFEDKMQRIWFATSSSHIGFLRNDSIFYLPCSERFANENGYGQKVFYQIVSDEKFNVYVSSHERAYKINAGDSYSSYELIQQNDYYLKIVDINHHSFCIPDTIVRLRSFNEIEFNLLIYGNKIELNWDIGVIKQGITRNCYPAIDNRGNVFFNINSRVFKVSKVGVKTEVKFENLVYHIFIDKQNNLWVGLNSKGLFMYPNADLNVAPKQLLMGETISGIHQDFEGGIWVSSLNKGIFYCKNLANENLINKEHFNYKPEMLKIIDTCLFMSDYKSSIVKLNLKNQEVEYRKVDVERSMIGILDIDKIENGFLLSGRNSLYRVNHNFKYLGRVVWEKKLQFSSGSYNTIITNDNQIIGISKNYVTNYTAGFSYKLTAFGNDILEYENIIFAATKNKLLQFTNHESNYFKTVIDNENIIKLLNFEAYLLVVCRDGKIYKLNSKLQKQKIFIGNASLNDASLLNNSKLLIASNAGIFILNLISNKVEHLTTSDGLLDNEVFKIASYADKAYYSTIYGIGTFSVENIKKNTVPPKVVLFQVKVDQDQLFHVGSTYNYSSSFAFNFDLISFKENSPVKMYYQLKGYDTNWKSNENGEINYTNLHQGEYDLLVYAQNNSGIKSAVIHIPFSIQIPFFRTWWFIALVLLAMLLLGYIVYRITYYFIDKREVSKTRINKLIAEYQLMGLKAQMNPHFIFNCLNSIQKYVLEHDSKQAYTYMAKFSKLIRFVLDISDKTFVALSDEIELVKLYVELEQLRFDKKFSFNIEIEESIKIDDILIPSLLIQPYLENAIWHGIMNLPSDKFGEVKITIYALNNILKIVIADNGIGRAEAKLFNEKTHQSKGISINQKRIEAINYLLKTNEAIVAIEDLINNNNKAEGTKVIINLPIKYEE